MNISKIALLLLFATAFANAGSEIVELGCVRDKNELTVVGRNKIVFEQELREALYAGIDLSFEYQIKLGDDVISFPYRLSFDVLNRAYLLKKSDGIQRFADLYSLLAVMEEISLQQTIKPELPLEEVSLRFYFDKENLPFPLRWYVFWGSEWDLSSEWRSCGR
ncbi:MAG: DUF4390 domain-containing protein [Cardiobacteriaceae bacterium]|nr:DUF4390 domain-containing protein [Cardiobacteriaceae bacterium]